MFGLNSNCNGHANRIQRTPTGSKAPCPHRCERCLALKMQVLILYTRPKNGALKGNLCLGAQAPTHLLRPLSASILSLVNWKRL